MFFAIEEQKPITLKSSSPSIEFAPERKATHAQWKVLDNDLPMQIPMIYTIKVEGYIRCKWMQINGIW